MFRHRSAIFRESMETKFHKSNTQRPVLNALTVTFKILNRKNSRAHKVDCLSLVAARSKA